MQNRLPTYSSTATHAADDSFWLCDRTCVSNVGKKTSGRFRRVTDPEEDSPAGIGQEIPGTGYVKSTTQHPRPDPRKKTTGAARISPCGNTKVPNKE